MKKVVCDENALNSIFFQKVPYDKNKKNLEKNNYKKEFRHFFCCHIIQQMTTKSCKKMQTNFSCIPCDFVTSNKFNYDKHVLTPKHKIQQNTTKYNKIYFSCDCCDFNTSNRYNYDKHILSAKHKNHEIVARNLQETAKALSPQNENYIKKDARYNIENNEKNEKYKCECGKLYAHRASLYNHRTKCSYLEYKSSNDKKSSNEILSSNDVSKDVILKLVDENSEIKSMLFKQFEAMQEQHITLQNENKDLRNKISELIPKVGSNNNNTITNNVKQKFNINIFLNEQCKDALTMNEFIDKIKVTLDDLMITKNKGLSEGISNIFIENMNKLSLHERPMHCTDVKRETVYIKCDDDNGENGGIPRWEKDEQNKKLKSALNRITHVQRKNMSMWIDIHPNWEDNPDEQDEYLKLIKNCTDDLNEKNRGDKIIRKLCNEVYVG